MILSFKEIKFRNIFSYGNNWNKYKFDNNINFIISGDKIRSNTMGKTSMLKPISFALYGKVKDVIQADIINWQNDKHCEVHLLIEKNGDEILIKRGLRPNFLMISINGEEQPQDSDVRVAQKNLEDNIIGMNFNTFWNLIFCNPNNTISILEASSTQKRKFIENLFSDLTYFSELMLSTNDKLKNIKDKIKDHKIKSKYIADNISTLQAELKNLVSPDIEKSHGIFESLKKEYEDAVSNNLVYNDQLKQLLIDFDFYKKIIDKYDNAERTIKDKLYKLKLDKNSLEKDLKKAEDIEVHKNTIKEIDQFIKDIGDIEDLSKDVKNISNSISKQKAICTEIEIDINNLKKQKESTKPDYNLKKETTCPTCRATIDYDQIKEHFAEDRKKLTLLIKEEEKKLKNENKKLKKLEKEEKDTLEKYKNNEKLKNDVKSAQDKKNILQNFIKGSENIDIIVNRIKLIDKKIKALTNGLTNIFKFTNAINSDKIEIEKKINEIKENDNKLKNLKNKLDNAEIVYKNDKKILDDIENRIANKKIKIDAYRKEAIDILNSNKSLNDLKDHLMVLKDVLKDENIKSHVIKMLIPYLDKKVNDYLSNLGFDFYVNFDSWLNIKITGPGGRNDCKLGSMSGAEQKSIDLCTKFALMDIAKIKAKIYPDILILDEILDSSIDDFGIEKLMEIVKYKQETDNIKIFIISHKKEINEINFGNVYKVFKKNGFSYLDQ